MIKVSAGVDLGGTASRIVVVCGKEVLASRILGTSDLGAGGPAQRLDRMADIVRAMTPAHCWLVGVGIGASGPVDRDAGLVRNPDTLPMFSGFPLVAGLEERLAVPVVIDNDALAAAIAEHRVGAGRGAYRMLMVTLGTGIGAALLIDGLPFRGPGGAHPEGGHIPVGSVPEPCYCGAIGCWEQVASRTALQRLLRPLLPDNVPDRDLLRRAASEVDRPGIRDAWRSYGVLLGRGLSVHHALYMPSVTVVGGSAAVHLELFRAGMEQSLRRTPEFAVDVEVRIAELGDEAGAIGAARMAADSAGLRRAGPAVLPSVD